MLKNITIGQRTANIIGSKTYWNFELLNETEALMVINGIVSNYTINTESTIPANEKVIMNTTFLYNIHPFNTTDGYYLSNRFPYRVYMEQSGKYFLQVEYLAGNGNFTSIDAVTFTITNYTTVTPITMDTTTVDIVMSKSPYWVNYYNNYKNFTFIEIDLFIWAGDFAAIPSTPTYTLTSHKITPTSTGVHLNISDYIADMIDPVPNSSFFDNISTANFGEIINFKYQIRSYLTAFGSSSVVEIINSDLKLATLGYGLHSEGSNPKITIYVDENIITIDSILISIDSGIVTIDSGSYDKLTLNEHKYHTYNTFVYDASLYPTATGTQTLIKREFTSNYKLVCAGLNTPHQIMYLDRNGILDTYTFPRSSTRTLKMKNEKYNRLKSTPWNYSTAERTSAIINKNADVNWSFNTDILDEINVSYIEQLVASDRHWLIDYSTESFIPINLTETDFVQKTALNDKAKMQYTLSFVEANDYQNNIK